MILVSLMMARGSIGSLAAMSGELRKATWHDIQSAGGTASAVCAVSAADAAGGAVRHPADHAAGRPAAALCAGPAALRARHGRLAHGGSLRSPAEPASKRCSGRHQRPGVERVQDAHPDRPRAAGQGDRRGGRGRCQGDRHRHPVHPAGARRSRGGADRGHAARQGQGGAGGGRRADRPDAGGDRITRRASLPRSAGRRAM